MSYEQVLHCICFQEAYTERRITKWDEHFQRGTHRWCEAYSPGMPPHLGLGWVFTENMLSKLKFLFKDEQNLGDEGQGKAFQTEGSACIITSYQHMMVGEHRGTFRKLKDLWIWSKISQGENGLRRGWKKRQQPEGLADEQNGLGHFSKGHPKPLKGLWWWGVVIDLHLLYSWVARVESGRPIRRL